MAESKRYWAKATNLELLEFLAGSRTLQVEVEWLRVLRQKEIYNKNWHAHRNAEIHFILEGSIQFYFENTMIEVSAGSAMFVPAQVQHRLLNPRGGMFLEVILNCGLQMLQETPEGLFLHNAFSRHEPLQFVMDVELKNLLNRCQMEDFHRISGFVTTIECCIMLIVMNVARQLTGNPPAQYSINERVDLVNMRAKQILEYIEQNPRISLSVAQIAAYAGLSIRQAQRIIQAHCHTTISAVVRSICLKQAKALLKSPAHSIVAIAYELDFSSEQAFSRFFSREEGMTPNEYRRSIMPQPEHFTIR